MFTNNLILYQEPKGIEEKTPFLHEFFFFFCPILILYFSYTWEMKWAKKDLRIKSRYHSFKNIKIKNKGTTIVNLVKHVE